MAFISMMVQSCYGLTLWRSQMARVAVNLMFGISIGGALAAFSVSTLTFFSISIPVYILFSIMLDMAIKKGQ